MKANRELNENYKYLLKYYILENIRSTTFVATTILFLICQRLKGWLLFIVKTITVPVFTNYIKSLIFTLNNSPSDTKKEGNLRSYAQNILLKNFLSEFSLARGSERNLLIRKYIKEIIYSPSWDKTRIVVLEVL